MSCEVAARPGRGGEHPAVRVRGADHDQPPGARRVPPATHRGHEEDPLSFARVAADPHPAPGRGHRAGEVEERRQGDHPFVPDAAGDAPGDHVLGRPRIVAAGPQLDVEVRRVEVDLADVEAPHGARATGRPEIAAEQRLREHDVGPALDDKDREVLRVGVRGVAGTGRHVQLGEYRHRCLLGVLPC